MGLTTVESIPVDAWHEPDQDATLPNGTRIEQFRVSVNGSVHIYAKFTEKDGHERFYRIDPNAGQS